MRQWLIRPPLELEVIEQRHETVACFLRTENGVSIDASLLRHLTHSEPLRSSFCRRRDS